MKINIVSHFIGLVVVYTLIFAAPILAMNQNETEEVEQKLFDAVISENQETVKQLIIECITKNNVRVDTSLCLFTPEWCTDILYHVVNLDKPQPDLIQALLFAGARPYAHKEPHTTPLHLAIQKANHNEEWIFVVEGLLGAAKPNVNPKDEMRKTPLDYADPRHKTLGKNFVAYLEERYLEKGT